MTSVGRKRKLAERQPAWVTRTRLRVEDAFKLARLRVENCWKLWLSSSSVVWVVVASLMITDVHFFFLAFSARDSSSLSSDHGTTMYWRKYGMQRAPDDDSGRSVNISLRGPVSATMAKPSSSTSCGPVGATSGVDTSALPFLLFLSLRSDFGDNF